MMRFEAIAMAVAMIVVLVFQHLRQRRRLKAERGAAFDQCRPLFDVSEIRQEDVAYPELDGMYHGLAVRLRLVDDQVAYRKLPSLWLQISIVAPLPGRSTFDMLVRPQNTEFYSPCWDLPVSLPLPAGWPAHALLRTDDPDAVPTVEELAPHIELFEDLRAKELLVTAKGVRLVYQVSQAERSRYLVLRQSQFDDLPLDAALVRRLLDRAVALYRGLAAPEAAA